MREPARILVADDEPTARLLMSAALQKAGYAVSAAVDGEDALRQFRAEPFDLVMLDVEMPGLDGYQACAALRREAGDELPIVIVTAMDDTGSVERAYECGATDFISKPINWALIGHRVKYLLRAYTADLQLRSAIERNAAVLNAIPDLLFEMDREGRYLDYRSPRTDLLAAPPEAFLGRTVAEVLPPDAAAVCIAALREAEARGISTGRQIQLQLPLGTFWFELSVSRMSDEREQAARFVVLSRDITERKRAEAALRDSESRLHQAQAVAHLGSWHLDARTRTLEWSPETYRIFGVPDGQPITYESFLQCVHADDRQAVDQAWQDAVRGKPYRIEHRILVGGAVRWVAEQAELSFDDSGKLISGTGTAQDITERKEIERQTFRLAYFDSLTGLPNRQSFMERLAREVADASNSGRKLAILFMDLDGFKGVNDTMGHNTGDLILQWASDRLRRCIRPTDMVSRLDENAIEVEFARLGGDEFTAIIPDIAHAEDALRVGHRIREQMRRPFVLDGREVVLTASIGIAVYPDDGVDAASLLKHADTAMYHAKDKGRDNCQFYSASLTQRAQQRLNLESNLRQALERGEFSLVYQPQFDLVRGSIHSVEALIRWNHPTEGIISPMDFIPLAEENGLIVPIGEWVLRTACSDAARWQREGHGLTVAVNLSPMQFRDPNLVRTVFDILEETGLAPQRLELEVTETAVMEDNVATLSTLEALNLRGVQIALDDFGTGYSSMNYLKRMPLNNLKVDRSFVHGLPHDRDNHAIVRAILSLAKNLGFSVTAEGVETIEQVESLRSMACDTLQGYYFSRPVPAADIPGLLARAWVLDEPAASRRDPAASAMSGS
jgi:diguanylate cyclase (GGDEF)-like protein/PAS domain S-box-containing protein